MKKVKLDIVGLSYSQTQSGAYALVLGEVNGRRRLPIIIGAFEAQAIAIEIEKMTPTRPLTHDLFKTFAQAYHIEIQEIIIYNLVDGVFFAKLICSDGETTQEIDARTSDAIALAVRFNAVIYTYEFILSSAGIVIEGNDFLFLENMDSITKEQSTEDMPTSIPVSGYQGLTDEELQQKLEEALAEEAYEKAARIRDELNKRNSS
ncbi:MAG: bifunctional nuclease family protein [Flavobacterium sp.]|jgi:bifunctional DNase/RNase|uniref:bifunctional nuclease family protein n=1 Tax=Pedobacter frigiditerrae TaxID=2530452 RepID=UPI001217F8F8|nr:bifunctional nuclease family protein [Pedobacter frigiditerrae]RZJ48859.1 MAG: bifunctional nuclease family protein [Flavobacterium sp.]